MAVNLILLLLSGLTGIHSITTVSKVSVKAGQSISIPCLYDSQYRNHVKYLCKGSSWNSCSYAVKTNQQSSGRFSISDDESQRIFTVTINDLTAQDTDYWCAVEVNGSSDHSQYFHLSVTEGSPSLYVDQQEITAFNGEKVTIKCNQHNYGYSGKWCKLGGSCVTGSSGSIEGINVSIERSLGVFSVTMSRLRTANSGWYWCASGDFQMPVHVTVLEKPTTRIHSITTVSKVSVKAGQSISIPCLYDSQYRNHVKYLCKGSSWSSCSYAVKTNQQSSRRFSISDDKSQRIFTVTIKNVNNEDTDYWCAVEVNGGFDDGQYFHLSVTEGVPSLSVEHQYVTANKGQNITISFNRHNSGVMKWCRLGGSCVMGLSGSIDGASVTIERSLNVVTMSGLRIENSGWYLCAEGDLQMPVHVTVHERPTMTTLATSTHLTTTSPAATEPVTVDTPTATRYSSTLSPTSNHLNHTVVFASEAPAPPGGHLSFIIRLSLLGLFVMVISFIWFIVKIHRPTRGSKIR